MKRKRTHILAMLALAGLMYPMTGLQAKEYKIPETQELFAQQWETVPGETEATWEWMDATIPYATSKCVSEGQTGPSLILAEPIHMNAGDIYYLQASVSTNHYNNDGWFYIVYGTDKNNLSAMPDDNSSFKCWGDRNGNPNFTVKPSEFSDLRKLTISEDGDYYIGIRTKKGSNAETMFCVASLFVEKDVNYPQKVTGTKATADANGNLEVTLTWTWPTKFKDNTDMTGEVGARIYRHTSNTKAELYKPENLIATVTGGTPGDSGTFTDNATNSTVAITEPGKFYYYIAPFVGDAENSDCTSSTVTECKWVGEDVKPLNPLSAVAKAVGDDAEVSWQARMQGYNGGYLNPEYFSYKITRSKDGADAVTVVENYKGESPYTDTTLEGPGSYVYRVYAVYKDVESSEAKAMAIFAGGSFDVPYEDDFSDANRFKMYTLISDYYSNWNRDYNNYIKMNGSSYSRPTSLVITPPLKLEAGKTYKLSCDSWVDEVEEEDDWYGSWTEPDPKDLVLTAGAEPTMEGQAELVTVNINKGESEKIHVEGYFTPNASGTYCFGLKATAGNTNYIYADNLRVEESIMLPATITDLTATPDANGANKVTVAFTMPDKSNSGSDLSKLTRVTVMRTNGETGTETGTGAVAESVTVRTFEGEEVAPGKAVSFEDNVPEAGMYSYSVVSAVDEYESEAAVTEQAWVGYDIPKSVSSFTIRAEVAGKGDASVTWSAISSTTPSIHGGYVDMANLKYRIYRKSMIVEGEPELVGETSELQFTDVTLKNAAWDYYSYGVSAVNGTQEGDVVFNNKVGGGKITEMPYSPDLTSDMYIESLPGRSFICEDGLKFKNRGEQGTMEYIAYLPPFESLDPEKPDFSIELNLSRGNSDYEEQIEVFLCEIERTALDLEGEGEAGTEAVVIPGEENRTALKTIAVSALADEPAKETVTFAVPATGRYRLALRCASQDNKELTVHSLIIDKSVDSSVTEIDANGGISIEGDRLMLPANVETVSIYSADGICIMTYDANADSVDLTTLNQGLYIVRITTTDNLAYTVKVNR